MKKALAILLSSFYLLLSVGATVNFHYCGGTLSSVKVYATSHSCCCVKAGVEEMNGCCEDDTFFVQLDEKQNKPSVSSITFTTFAELALWNKNYDVITIKEEVNVAINCDLPPPNIIPAYITNLSLTYYG